MSECALSRPTSPLNFAAFGWRSPASPQSPPGAALGEAAPGKPREGGGRLGRRPRREENQRRRRWRGVRRRSFLPSPTNYLAPKSQRLRSLDPGECRRHPGLSSPALPVPTRPPGPAWVRDWHDQLNFAGLALLSGFPSVVRRRGERRVPAQDGQTGRQATAPSSPAEPLHTPPPPA